MFLSESTSQATDEEKINPGPRPLYGLGFRTGKVINVFSYSLYWLVHYAGLTDVIYEVLKDGEQVIYGELSFNELDRLVEEGYLRNIRRHSWGISWPFKEQACGGQDDFSDFHCWREKVLADAQCFQPIYDFSDQSLRLLS